MIASINPSDGSVLGEVATATRADVERAFVSARSAQPAWAALTVEQRCAILQSFIQLAQTRFDELCRLITAETGRTAATVRGHVEYGVKYLSAYCDMAPAALAPVVTVQTEGETHTVYRQPFGVVAAICPWNYPFLNVAWQCGQALLAGNTVVYKNSEENPLFAENLRQMVIDAGLPEGVLTVLIGDGEVGQWMAQSAVDLISFTGSTTTGRALAAVAAERFVPFVGEMGGSSPCVVLDDVNLDDIVETIFWGRFFYSGQTCDSMKRLIVHESLADELTARLVARAERTIVGDAADAQTEMGPMVAVRQVERIHTQVEDAIAKGAKVLTGGQPAGGCFYPPTVLANVTPNMRVWTEETFGPVLPVVSFATDEEALALANDTEYGLTANVFTNDARRFAYFASGIDAGAVVQNGGTYENPASPFGGFKSSGQGRVNGLYGFEELTQPKVVSTAT